MNPEVRASVSKDYKFRDDNGNDVSYIGRFCKVDCNLCLFHFASSGGNSQKKLKDGEKILIERLHAVGIKRVNIYKRSKPASGRLTENSIMKLERSKSNVEIDKMVAVRKDSQNPQSYLLISSNDFNKELFDYVVSGDKKSKENYLKTKDNDYDIFSRVRRRLYQSQFRNDVLHAYDKKCFVTGCSIEEILEAAHIVPYAQRENIEQINDVCNGVLLRPDIHALFDAGLLELIYKERQDGKDYTFIVKVLVKNKDYDRIDRKEIILPQVVDVEKFKKNLNIRQQSK